MIRLGFIIVLLFIFSCGSSDKKFKGENFEGEISIQFNPRLDTSYVYSVLSKTNTHQEVANQKIEISNNTEMETSYQFSKDSASGFKVALQYKKFIISYKDQNGEKIFNSNNIPGMSSPNERILSAFNDAKLTARIDTGGTVLSVQGKKEIADKMLSLAAGNQEALQTAKTTIAQYASESSLKESVEQNFRLFAHKKMKIGDTIQQTIPIDAGIKFTINSIYKLIAVDDNVASFELKGNIDLKNQTMQVQGINVLTSFTGTQNGLLEINIQSGMTKNNESKIELKGNLQVSGKEVPMEIRIENKVTLQ